MDSFIPVEGHTNLVRDPLTKSIINTSKSDYEKYMKIKSIKESEKNRIDEIESKVQEIKSDISEVKVMLSKLINS